MKKNNSRQDNKNRTGLTVTAVLLTVLLIFSYSCVYFADIGRNSVKRSEIITLDKPDPALMGGWIFQNPDNEFELLAFEFGPDSTFVVMNYANGMQVGEKVSGKCVYLTVKGYPAIEMTTDGGGTKYYYYTVVGDYATFTDKDTGEVMPLKLVKKVTLAE